MDGYGAASYGDAFADVYDDWYAEVTDAAACTARVAALAREVAGASSPVVLELGVGTGRLALPLADTGLDVRGLDASSAMLDRLAAKQAGAATTGGPPGPMGDPGDPAPRQPVAAARADFAVPFVPTRPGEGSAPRANLVLCAYNSLFNLADEAAQRRCIAGVAGLLAPGGRFVVEAFVPPEDAVAVDDVRVRHLTADTVVLAVSVHEPEEQRVEGQFVELRDTGVRMRPWSVRYLTVAQLDEACAGVGLELEHRWADWERQPFTDASADHVSVYRRA